MEYVVRQHQEAKEAVEPGSESEEDGSRFKHSILKLLKTKHFMMCKMGVCMEGLAISGIGTFLPKFFETQYFLSSADARFERFGF